MEKEFELLFAAMISGRAKAEFMVAHGNDAQKLAGQNYIEAEENLKKFYEEKFSNK